MTDKAADRIRARKAARQQTVHRSYKQAHQGSRVARGLARFQPRSSAGRK